MYHKTPEEPLARYRSIAPTARVCIEYDEEAVTEYLRQRNSVIQDLDNLASVKSLFDRLVTRATVLSLDPISQKICLIRRLKQGEVGNNFTVSPISDLVSNMLALHVETLTEHELLEMWKKFSNFPDARGMLGSVFEAYTHKRFRKKIEFYPSPMHRAPRSNSRSHASFSRKIPASAKPLTELLAKPSAKPSAEPIKVITIANHNTIVYEKDQQLTIEPGVYYIPRSGQQVALDSFILYDGFLYIYQCTGSKDHGIKDGIISFLRACKGLPATDLWRFVFVVPDDLESFSCPASRNDTIQSLFLYTTQIAMSNTQY